MPTPKSQPTNMLETFCLGMDRYPMEFKVPVSDTGLSINLGAGRKQIFGADGLDWESGWEAPSLPYDDGAVDNIWAFHFFEHLEGAKVVEMLKECQRVMHSGSTLNIVSPHYTAEAAFQDLDHKSFWTESTFKNLLENEYYEGKVTRSWDLQIRSVMIMGVVQRNLAVVAQLVKR